MIVVFVFVAGGLLLMFKGDDLIKAFEQALDAARAGHISAEELAGFLLGTRSELEDGKLTSEEMDSMVQQLNEMADAKPSSG